MIPHTHSGIAQDIPFESAAAGVQSFAYTDDTPLAQGSAIERGKVQSSHVGNSAPMFGTEAIGLLLLLLIAIYGFAKWWQRRAQARVGGDFLPDRKLDPENIRVHRIQEK